MESPTLNPLNQPAMPGSRPHPSNPENRVSRNQSTKSAFEKQAPAPSEVRSAKVPGPRGRPARWRAAAGVSVAHARRRVVELILCPRAASRKVRIRVCLPAYAASSRCKSRDRAAPFARGPSRVSGRVRAAPPLKNDGGCAEPLEASDGCKALGRISADR